MTIDSHQHFWRYNEGRDKWMTDDMKQLRNDFLPHHLEKELKQTGFDGCIAVQTDQSEAENEFLLSLAKGNSFIKGIVGWVDMCADDVEERLAFYANEPMIKGFRHILQGENDRQFMLQSSFMKGIAQLKQYSFTYDILIYVDQLLYLPQFVGQHPDQKFVINHLAKPNIKNNNIMDWKKQIIAIAKFPNVWCKVSGMITEADWHHWKPEELVPYLDIVWEAFGIHRLMFGSDWPVCLLAGNYNQWVNLMKEYTASFSEDERKLFWGNAAALFYNI